MTSTVAPHENGILESLDSSEFSLIPEHPFDGEEDQKEMTNSQYDLGSDLPIQDLSTVEIQKRLVELVEDNDSMKKALKYNNVLMKEQLHTISEWHNQMTSSLSQQRTSLVEAHLKIEELEKENEELLKKVASISQHEKTPSIDYEIDFEIIQEKKEEEAVKEQINETEEVPDQFQPLVDSQNAENEESLKAQMNEAQIKVFEFQMLVERQNVEINDLKALCEMKEEENTNLKVQLANHNELKSKYESLVHENKPQQRKVKSEEEQFLLLMEEAEKQFAQEQNALKKKSLVHEIKSQQRNATSEEERLKLLLQEADKQYAQEQNALQKERINHAETKKLMKDLQEKYNRVDKLLQIQSKDQKQKDEKLLSERVLDTKRSLEQIDELTAKLFDLEQQLEDRNERVKELSAQLEAVRQDSESIPILKAQLDVYKADLSNDKEAAQKEIERLSQELGDLQTAVSFCSSCGAGNAHADAAKAKGRRRQGSSHQDLTFFLCPLCNFGFKDVKALENHVNGCLDKAQ